MTKVRLVRNDGELLELDCMSYSLNITRSVPVLPVPVFGERYSVDLNMVTADYKLTVMLADDDCASSSFEKKAAVASIDFSARKEDSSGSHSVLMSGDGAGGISAGIAKSTFSKVVTNSTAVDSIVSAGGICGPIGTFKNIELVQGLSAQDGLIEGYTGEYYSADDED